MEEAGRRSTHHCWCFFDAALAEECRPRRIKDLGIRGLAIVLQKTIARILSMPDAEGVTLARSMILAVVPKASAGIFSRCCDAEG